MLSVVVDDHDMGITHIIRGDDHLTNAFRQQRLYHAFGWEVPVFAHIPLIHGPDGAKLSKRHGALGAEAYRDMGFLPEAIQILKKWRRNVPTADYMVAFITRLTIQKDFRWEKPLETMLTKRFSGRFL